MELSDAYINSFVQPRSDLLMEMEAYAEANHVPIMQLAAIDALNQLLRIQNPAKILEIGSAIGYSAIRMAEALPTVEIVTIERDTARIAAAKDFLARSNVAQRIRLIEGDALEVAIPEGEYDAIFIDAAKGQYQRFFERYERLVPSGGVLYIDNMYMHGLSDLALKDVPRRKRTMIRNLKNFTDWIMAHPQYTSAFLPVGDGLLLCLKR
ncbi:MAG TPA: O-methyltransferase [Metalysinibacillus jejuensis]|uniref:tRNA 5-hydroxyuridine methyltransferase n=1 Tax=Metalysinibacillus jejuensis TaxID=914327 RepID=A0A921T4P9_9BACL|nr:O-methyltransferase [Metalysinibacillus jejuensis]HJH10787.1 O-methyltransferase [Metalysinibacillus jejuensis]